MSGVRHDDDVDDRRPNKRQHRQRMDVKEATTIHGVTGHMAAALVSAAQRQHMIGSVDIAELQPMHNAIIRDT